MKHGNEKCSVEFRSRRFWPTAFWVAFLCIFGIIGVVFRAFAFFTAVLVSSFVGLNEFGRFRYKTNLIICAAAAAVTAVTSDFTVVEIISMFFMFVIISGYIFYFRSRTLKTITNMAIFADSISSCRNVRELTETTYRCMAEMAPEAVSFIVLADEENNLFVPANGEDAERTIKRKTGAAGRVFASGKAETIANADTGRDLPLDRDALSIVAVPICARGEKLGVIEVEAGTMAAFDKNDAAHLELLAAALGAQLYLHIYDIIPKEEG